MPKKPPTDEAGLIDWILKNRSDLVDPDPQWRSQFPDLFTASDQDPNSVYTMNKFAHYDYGVFEAWVRAMLDDDFLFTGDVIPETRAVYGRGSSRVDEAVEAHGCALIQRDRARPSEGYQLIGGYCRHTRRFYAFRKAGDMMLRIGQGAGWHTTMLDRLHHWNVWDAHIAFRRMDKLPLLQQSNSGNLDLEAFQLADFLECFHTEKMLNNQIIGGGFPWWFECFMDEWFRKGLTEARQTLHSTNEQAQTEADLTLPDRVFFIRWGKAMSDAEIQRIKDLPLGIPPAYEYVIEALEVGLASDIIF